MRLPAVAGAVTAEAVEGLPGRLRKRLDEVVAQARGWAVERDGELVVVRVDEQVVVTLGDPVVEAGDARCSCLLSPRCLHRAAVLSVAPVLEEGAPAVVDAEALDPPMAGVGAVQPAAAEALPAAPVTPPTAVGAAQREPAVEPAPPPAAVSVAQREAAEALSAAAAAVLVAGIPGSGAVTQADLLRAVHQARAAGLHAPAAAGVRVVERLRAARGAEPALRLAELHDDLLELLSGCHRLAAGDPGAAGVARRDYEPVGDLRLRGLCCEPVRTATGHAGAATHLADERGRIWVVSDVKPAGPGLTVATTGTPVELGEVRLSHHELARGGLLAINAHASAAGRLSHGRARQAVAAPGASWFAAPLDALWGVAVGAQVHRWLGGGSDLGFLDGTVLGADRRGLLLLLEPSGLVVVVTAPHEDPALPFVHNMRLLAGHAAGHRLRLIGRFTGAREVAGLAVAAGWLPDRHGGHVDLGAVSLSRADLPGADVPALGSAGAPLPVPQAPPLHLLRHHLERVVAAGRPVLLAGVGDDVRRLAAAQLSTAAAVLTGLGAAGTRRTRDVFGRLDPHDARLLARAWLTAAVYEQAAGKEATRTAWIT